MSAAGLRESFFIRFYEEYEDKKRRAKWKEDISRPRKSRFSVLACEEWKRKGQKRKKVAPVVDVVLVGASLRNPFSMQLG